MHSSIQNNSLRIRRHGRQSISGFMIQTLGLLLVLLALVGLARAAGNLDPSFGGGTGRILKTVGPNTDQANAIAIQPDGKIVVAGFASTGPANNVVVVRFNADGTNDPTFNIGSPAVFDFSPFHDEAKAVALQSDGKIVIAGLAYVNDLSRIFVARITSNGVVDETFGTGGRVIFSGSPGHDVANAVAIQNVNGEEKIVVAGSAGGSDSHIAVARLNSNGSFDNSFGTGGRLTTVVGSKDVANDVVIQRVGGQDRIVVVGYSQFQVNGSFLYDFTLVRYLTNGTFDNSFDGDGKVTTDLTQFDEARSVVVQPVDGQNKLVVGGWSYLGQKYRFTVIRYLESGAVDNTFGTQGNTVTPIGPFDSQIMALTRQSDNKIVAAGVARTGTGSNPDFALARYNANGMLDTTFGSCGTILNSYSQDVGPDYFFDVAIGDQGKVVAAGIAAKGAPGASNADIMVARYLTTGRAASPTSIDFDGDARADLAIFRPEGGAWHMNNSCQGVRSIQFGANGDRNVPADYDGDGKTDIAVFRQGAWYVLRSGDNSFYGVNWGIAGDIPVTGDYDDDRKADIAIYRPVASTWYIMRSANGQMLSAQFGTTGDIPVPGDHDNDGRADAAVFRPSTGTWYALTVSGLIAKQFGQAGDVPQTGDFDADGQLDLAVFRPANGSWYLLQSAAGFAGTQFGVGTDTPIVGDFDGDTKDDIAVFRAGAWFVLTSTAGLRSFQWGTAGDIPAGE
jgi:uncharacterized delta-60 repeat protein